jgi:hypothetical protein
MRYLQAPTSKEPLAPPPLRVNPVARNRPGYALMRVVLAAALWSLLVTFSEVPPLALPVRAVPVAPGEVPDGVVGGVLNCPAAAVPGVRVVLVAVVEAAEVAGVAAAWPLACSAPLA